MRNDVHIVFGIGSSLIAGYYLDLVQIPFLIIGGFIGSIAPDFDLRIRHRRFFHNLFFLVAVLLLTVVISLSLGLSLYYVKAFDIGFTAGFSSHLFGDVITFRGVDLLYPFSKKSFKIPIGSSKSLLVNSLGMIIGVSEIILFVYLRIF